MLYLMLILKIISSEGVQVGGLRSTFGVLGSWTTIFHDADDPVGKLVNLMAVLGDENSWYLSGPFWMHKLKPSPLDSDSD